jgi:hypothetical protein
MIKRPWAELQRWLSQHRRGRDGESARRGCCRRSSECRNEIDEGVGDLDE